MLVFNLWTIISLNNFSILEQLNPTNNRGLFVVSRNDKSQVFFIYFQAKILYPKLDHNL